MISLFGTQSLKRGVVAAYHPKSGCVCEDADLATAIPAISEYKFECAGQSCNAPSRILVARSRYEEFLFRMTEAVRRIRIGPPDNPATQMGPMANARRIEAMQRLTKDAVECGARIETGGTPLDGPGFYWPPTILTGVPKEARVLHEEPFGPILTVAPFDTIEEAIEEANATEYGLAAYLFTGAADTYYHPPDYIRSLSHAYTREQSPSAKNAIGQILLNSRMATVDDDVGLRKDRR